MPTYMMAMSMINKPTKGQPAAPKSPVTPTGGKSGQGVRRGKIQAIIQLLQRAGDSPDIIRAVEEALKRRRKYIYKCYLHTARRWCLFDGRTEPCAGSFVVSIPQLLSELRCEQLKEATV